MGNRGKIRIKDAYSVRLVMDLTSNPDKSMVHRRCERRDGAKGRHAHALSWGKKEGGEGLRNFLAHIRNTEQECDAHNIFA